ncbi:hypothetical protein MU516_16185 [Paracoccus sp. YLB-12]|uniref:Uncharacterized protein n=1 Tax=Paracoccus maritimus TaxID=2933292 RepID=A0ABT2KCZ1_9RHOB|nr:hypothetical protein [Paracoccus sp. YLB-12]MCT4334402.1 hypothetical protein [Paracoccus sp. YLB-12]
MQQSNATVSNRIADAATARRDGALADHVIVECAEKNDGTLSNSWGPAMRR